MRIRVYRFQEIVSSESIRGHRSGAARANYSITYTEAACIDLKGLAGADMAALNRRFCVDIA